MAHAVFDVIAKNPKIEHVSPNMSQPGMHEHAGENIGDIANAETRHKAIRNQCEFKNLFPFLRMRKDKPPTSPIGLVVLGGAFRGLQVWNQLSTLSNL